MIRDGNNLPIKAIKIHKVERIVSAKFNQDVPSVVLDS